MSSLNALRKIIREEVVNALKQELPKFLNERSVPMAADYKKGLEKQVKKSQFHSNLNESMPPQPIFSSNNPLASLLSETAISMTTDDVHAISGNVEYQSQTNVGSVDAMINSAVKSSNIEMVKIDTVPDFSDIMRKMNIK
jgi:hypothetical protein